MTNRKFRTLNEDDKLNNLAGYAAGYYFDPEQEEGFWIKKREELESSIKKQVPTEMLEHQITVCGCSKGPQVVVWLPALRTLVCLGARASLVYKREA